jgi:4-amino-4-deoxy-L-arabinose transferase-like glycosyltransferase
MTSTWETPRRVLSTGREVYKKRPWFFAVLGVFLLLSVATVLTKLPFCDEAWYGNPALNLLTHGSMGTTVLESAGVPRLQGLPEHTYWEMPLYILTEAAWFKAVGFGLIRQRLLSTFWGMILLISWMIFVQRVTDDQKAAFLCGGLLAVDALFVSIGSTGRTDMMCAALGCAALASYMCLREKNLAGAVIVSQTLVATSGMTHPNGLVYFIALLVVSFWWDRGRLSLRYVGLAAIPYLAGALLWGAYIAQNPSDFRAQFGISAASRLGGLLSPLLALQQEIALRYMGTYWQGSSVQSSNLGRMRILILAVYLAGVAGAALTPAIRRQKPARLLLVLSALTFLFMVLYEGAKQVPYLILILPYFAALSAVFYLHIRKALPSIAAAVLVSFVILNVVPTLYLVYRNDFQSRYVTAVRLLQRELPQDGILMGGAELGYGLGFDRVIDDYDFGYESGKQANLLVVNDRYQEEQAKLRRKRPEVDQYIENTLSRKYSFMFDSGAYRIYALSNTRAYGSARPEAIRVITAR